MIGRDARRLGWRAACGAVAVVLVRAATGGWATFIRADGISFLMVARHLSGATLGGGDNAYRYGRVLYPLVAWVLAAGRPGWLLWTLPLVNAAAVGASVAVAAQLAVRRGQPARRGLLLLAVPASSLCLLVAWSESLLIALLLAAVLCLDDGREVAAALFLSLAVLTKETAAFALVPLVGLPLWRRDAGRAVVRAAAIAPAALWWSWCRFRLGQWPFLASTPSRTLAVAPPFAGLVQLVQQGVTAFRVVEVLLVLTVAAAGIAVWRRAPASPAAGAAAVLALFPLCFGLHVLIFPGDTLRVLSPALAMVIVLAGQDRRQDAPVPVGAAAE